MLVRFLRALADEWDLRRDPVAYARRIGVKIGRDCRFLGIRRGTFGSEPYLISIGDHVTITSGVQFITHDGGVWVFRNEHPDIDVFGPITIEHNVFIGLNTIILPGVTIGGNSVIGAGSVVTRNIPPGSVAAGVPAKVIKSLEEYRTTVASCALHVRSLPPAKKRRLIEEHVLKRPARNT